MVNDKIIETLLFANVDLNTKVTVDLFECEDVGSKAGYALFFGEENITLSYSKIANATQYIIKEVFGYNGEKLEEKTTETEIRSARQHLEVTDNNSRYVHDENGKVWFFDVSDKLNNAYDGNVKKVHPEYDFGLHPRLLYASEDMVVFEEFKNRKKEKYLSNRHVRYLHRKKRRNSQQDLVPVCSPAKHAALLLAQLWYLVRSTVIQLLLTTKSEPTWLQKSKTLSADSKSVVEHVSAASFSDMICLLMKVRTKLGKAEQCRAAVPKS